MHTRRSHRAWDPCLNDYLDGEQAGEAQAAVHAAAPVRVCDSMTHITDGHLLQAGPLSG